MNAAEFAAKWIGNTNTERSAAQEHFIDICMMLGVPTPNTDREGEAYAFEKGAGKTSGGKGWADVWLRGRFGWEYKGHHRDLEAAYKQLLNYREALENPPLLVVCDLDHFSIRTNFTNTIWHDYSFGVLYSHVHELWALALGTQLESRPRYTPLSTFGTFPFPRPTSVQAEIIATAARMLDSFRRRWLDPEGVNLAELKSRTITNLYNQRPSWLSQAHDRLDRAVFAAYGWPYPLDDQEILGRLLQLNWERAAQSGGVAMPTVVTDDPEEEL